MSLHLRLLVLGAVVALPALAVGVVTAGAETPAAAQPAVAPAVNPQPVAPATAGKAPGATALESGLRAYIEPETGKLGMPAVIPAPSPEEEAAKTAEEPVLIHMPDGSDMLDLRGTMQDYIVIQLDANGGKAVRCVEDPKAAVHAPPPAPQREDR
jgi:hypothetical protein